MLRVIERTERRRREEERRVRVVLFVCLFVCLLLSSEVAALGALGTAEWGRWWKKKEVGVRSTTCLTWKWFCLCVFLCVWPRRCPSV